MTPPGTDIITLLIRTDKDFIALKRFGYSLSALLTKYPENCPDRLIASALGIEEGQVQAEYERIVAKLRLLMGVEL